MFGAKAFKSTGTDIVTTASKMMTTTGSGSGGSAVGAYTMSPMESMIEVFLEIRDNTAQTVELLKTAVLGTPGQQRDKDISAGDTDPSDPPGEKGPGIFSRIGTTLGKLNPFGGGGILDTLLKLGLAVGGIALLNIFGDKAVGPLSGMIKAFKEGKIGEKISEVIVDIKEYLTPLWVNIKTKVGDFIEGVRGVFGIIESAYTAVQDYIMQFDTKGKTYFEDEFGVIHERIGDGVLDSEELQALQDDIKDKITTFMSDLFDGLFTKILPAIGGALLGATFISGTVRRIMGTSSMAALASTKPMMNGRPIQGPIKPGMVGAGTMFNIAGLLLYGITTTWMNTTQAYKQTLEENDGVFETKIFLANFFGGSDKGGLLNGLAQAFKVGGTGTLIGMSIGAFGGPAGIVAGGLIGMGIGALTGAITGYAGSDALEKIMNDTTSALSSAMDTIGNFFSDTIEGLGDLAEGGTFGESDIESAKRKVEQFQKMNPYIDVMNMSFEEAKALIIENVNADKKSNKKRRIESKIRALKRLHGADAQSEGGLGVGSIKILRESGVDIPALGDRLTALKEEKEALEGFKADKIRGFSDYRDYYDIDDATRIGKGAITSKLNSVIKEIAELEQDLNIIKTYSDKKNIGDGGNTLVDAKKINSENINHIEEKFLNGYHAVSDPHPAVSALNQARGYP